MATKAAQKNTPHNITDSTTNLQTVEYISSTESTTIGKIAQALCKAQLNMGKAQKSADNPYFNLIVSSISDNPVLASYVGPSFP